MRDKKGKKHEMTFFQYCGRKKTRAFRLIRTLREKDWKEMYREIDRMKSKHIMTWRDTPKLRKRHPSWYVGINRESCLGDK